MPRRTRRAYAPEFRRQMVELVRAGRSPEELAKEFEPTAKSIRNWVAQADRDEGRRADGLTTPSARSSTGCGVRTVSSRSSGRSCQKQRPGSLGRRTRSRPRVRVREREPGHPPCGHAVPRAGRLLQRVLRVVEAVAVAARQGRCRADRAHSRDPCGLERHLWGAAHPCRAQGQWHPRRQEARRASDAPGRSCRRQPPQVRHHDGSRRREQAPDLVERDFTAERPNMLWVADITYIPTWAGFLYLAVALDAFSRRIVGWAMATTLHTQLVLDALNMALATRRPKDVIHHSDQGSQYTSIAFGKRCREAGVRPSMGSVGDAYDNAMAESFFATLECELLDRRRFKTQAEARMAVFEFIEGFYNPRRRHSSLGYLSPVDYERRHEEKQAVDPGAHQPAVVLGAVKMRPGNVAASLDVGADGRS